jgi:hypothetical protein
MCVFEVFTAYIEDGGYENRNANNLTTTTIVIIKSKAISGDR